MSDVTAGWDLKGGQGADRELGGRGFGMGRTFRFRVGGEVWVKFMVGEWLGEVTVG